MKSILLTSLLFLSLANPLFAQRWGEDNWGIQVGISANIGTHINQFGLKVQGYYTFNFVQLNAGSQLRFNSNGLGGRTNYITHRINTGLVLMGGKRNINPQLVFDGLNHQTKYEYALAYNYLWYFDNIGTSQRSGGFGLHVQQFYLLMENDLFAGQGRDRFRTGYTSIGFHENLFNIAIATQLWTGETRGTETQRLSEKPYFGGYKDLRNLPFGKTSHGILSINVDYQVFYGNTVSASIGVDSESIRNGLQNKLMHNKVFIPKSMRNSDPNYPMLDAEGNPTLDKDKVRPNRFFFQAGLNRGMTY